MKSIDLFCLKLLSWLRLRKSVSAGNPPERTQNPMKMPLSSSEGDVVPVDSISERRVCPLSHTENSFISKTPSSHLVSNRRAQVQLDRCDSLCLPSFPGEESERRWSVRDEAISCSPDRARHRVKGNTMTEWARRSAALQSFSWTHPAHSWMIACTYRYGKR